MKIAEVRLSLLEKDEAGNSTKHVKVTVTDPAICAAIGAALGSPGKFAKAKDATHLHFKSPEEKAQDKQDAKDAAAEEEDETVSA
jgi:hypothetical protein